MFRLSQLTRVGRRAAFLVAAITLTGCVDPESLVGPSSGTTPPQSSTPPAPTTISGRVGAGGRNVHTVWVGNYDNFVIVQGDGDTDLDCWLYDSAGNLVSSDTDLTDYCILPSPGIGSHQVVIRNWGVVYNDYTIWKQS